MCCCVCAFAWVLQALLGSHVRRYQIYGLLLVGAFLQVGYLQPVPMPAQPCRHKALLTHCSQRRMLVHGSTGMLLWTACCRAPVSVWQTTSDLYPQSSWQVSLAEPCVRVCVCVCVCVHRHTHRGRGEREIHTRTHTHTHTHTHTCRHVHGSSVCMMLMLRDSVCVRVCYRMTAGKPPEWRARAVSITVGFAVSVDTHTHTH